MKEQFLNQYKGRATAFFKNGFYAEHVCSFQIYGCSCQHVYSLLEYRPGLMRSPRMISFNKKLTCLHMWFPPFYFFFFNIYTTFQQRGHSKVYFETLQCIQLFQHFKVRQLPMKLSGNNCYCQPLTSRSISST